MHDAIPPPTHRAPGTRADGRRSPRRRLWRGRGLTVGCEPRVLRNDHDAERCRALRLGGRRIGEQQQLGRRRELDHEDAERREVRRLLRVQRAIPPAALAPRAGPVPRREGGDPRPHPGAGGRGRGVRAAHRRAVRHPGRETPGRPVAGRHGALGLAHPHPDAPERRHQGPAVAGGRGRGGPGVRRQRARPAAGRAGRRADHDRP